MVLKAGEDSETKVDGTAPQPASFRHSLTLGDFHILFLVFPVGMVLKAGEDSETKVDGTAPQPASFWSVLVYKKTRGIRL
ncbi:UNVERIFIED_CONTAM: hypothetical protein FKN15_058245 [Acipenser sinensis]